MPGFSRSFFASGLVLSGLVVSAPVAAAPVAASPSAHILIAAALSDDERQTLEAELQDLRDSAVMLPWPQMQARGEALQDRLNKAGMLEEASEIYGIFALSLTFARDQDAARSWIEKGMAFDRERGLKRQLASKMAMMGAISGTREGMIEWSEKALAIWDALGDERGQAETLNTLVQYAVQEGQREKAKAWFDRLDGFMDRPVLMQPGDFIVSPKMMEIWRRGFREGAGLSDEALETLAREDFVRLQGRAEKLLAEKQAGGTISQLYLQEIVDAASSAIMGLNGTRQRKGLEILPADLILEAEGLELTAKILDPDQNSWKIERVLKGAIHRYHRAGAEDRAQAVKARLKALGK